MKEHTLTTMRIKFLIIGLAFTSTSVFSVGQELSSKNEQAIKQHCDTHFISATTPTKRFSHISNAMVLDKKTGLIWQRCTEGTFGAECEKGNSTLFSWDEALTHPQKINAGNGASDFNDWRLPNIRELSSLTELQCQTPSINTSVFPNTPAALFWSSSPYSFYPHYSWFVDFSNGSFSYGERKLNTYHVRLVRTSK